MSQKRRHVLGDLTNEFSHICKVPATTLKNTVEKIEAAAPTQILTQNWHKNSYYIIQFGEIDYEVLVSFCFLEFDTFFNFFQNILAFVHPVLS